MDAVVQTAFQTKALCDPVDFLEHNRCVSHHVAETDRPKAFGASPEGRKEESALMGPAMASAAWSRTRRV
jgi:hypothetical protein